MKILLIGNSGSGKSCLITRYVDEKFTANFYNTIGVDYKIKNDEINLNGNNSILNNSKDKDNIKVRLQIWDTAGQDRFKNITSSYYRGADGILILFDITDTASYQAIISWLAQIDKYADQEQVKRIMIGNKCDLSQRRQITYTQAQKYGQKLGIKYMETSARDGSGVKQSFHELARMILSNRKKTSESNIKNQKHEGGQKLQARKHPRRQSNPKTQGNNKSNCC